MFRITIRRLDGRDARGSQPTRRASRQPGIKYGDKMTQPIHQTNAAGRRSADVRAEHADDVERIAARVRGSGELKQDPLVEAQKLLGSEP